MQNWKVHRLCTLAWNGLQFTVLEFDLRGGLDRRQLRLCRAAFGATSDLNRCNDENNENRNRTLTRLRYYNQPEPAAGTDEQILEKVDQASRGGTVEFNEAMYARLKQMTAGHTERYH